MDGMNQVILFGTLGADPELRFGQSGADSAVLKLRMATNSSYFDKQTNQRKESTEWHSVVLFGKRAESLQKILEKGSTILVKGRLKTTSYDKDGQKHYRTDVVADEVILTPRGGGKKDSDASPKALRGNPSAPVEEEQSGDLPF